MPQTIVLACPSSVRLGDLRRLLEVPPGGRLVDADNEVQIQASRGDYVALWPMRDPAEVAEDYATNDDLDPRFRAEARDKTYFMCNFGSMALLRSVLQPLLRGLGAALPGCWIDSDYGWVARGPELLARLDSDPSWDFRGPAEEKWQSPP